MGPLRARHTPHRIRVDWVQLEPPDRGHFRLPEPRGGRRAAHRWSPDRWPGHSRCPAPIRP
ncbi:hypothetical protein Pd630_LPD15035 (plasmid) [Rhodococcus opacus PD630]|nr:hypothetical protein Pd630_LPD15035 [Rhodococcus opacus PD630]